MANTPIDEELGRESEKPSFRCPSFLLEYADQFQSDYNAVIGEIAADYDNEDETVESLTLDSRSEVFRRLIDIGLGAWYSDNVLMFAAPPGENVCPACGESGEKVRIGIIPREGGYEPESKLCLACSHEEMLVEEDDESVTDDPFDGVEA